MEPDQCSNCLYHRKIDNPIYSDEGYRDPANAGYEMVFPVIGHSYEYKCHRYPMTLETHKDHWCGEHENGW